MRPVLCGVAGRLWRGYDAVVLVLVGFCIRVVLLGVAPSLCVEVTML